MKKNFLLVFALVSMVFTTVIAFADDEDAPVKTVPTAWKVGYLIPSEDNFSMAPMLGVTLQKDLGASYVGAFDFDMSNRTDCSDDTPGVTTNFCRVKHRIAALTLKKKMNIGDTNNRLMLGAGIVYMMSDVNLTETLLPSTFSYHDSSNQVGAVVSAEVDGLFDEYPGIFFQARYIHAGEQTASVSRMTNTIGGFTISTGYRFKF